MFGIWLIQVNDFVNGRDKLVIWILQAYDRLAYIINMENL